LLYTASLGACPLLAGGGEVVSNVEIVNSLLEGTLYMDLCQQAVWFSVKIYAIKFPWYVICVIVVIPVCE